ncbi:MAG TPA: hypothetical protein DCQ06_05025 [Myxococcales bacterium]|nr:hypothetical protein [Myxococcales bacterium]
MRIGDRLRLDQALQLRADLVLRGIARYATRCGACDHGYQPGQQDNKPSATKRHPSPRMQGDR